MQFASDTQLHYGQEVKAYRGDNLTCHTFTQLPFKTIVWLFIKIEVNTHDGESTCVFGGMFDITITNRFLHVTHQYKRIVIDRLFLIDISSSEGVLY